MLAMFVFPQRCTLLRALPQRVRHSQCGDARAYSAIATGVSVSAPPGGKGASAACSYSFVGFKAQPGVRYLSAIPTSHPPQDLVLFKYQRPGFFRLLALFCIGQAVFWAYLGQYGFSSLRDTQRGASKGGSSSAMGNEIIAEEPGVTSRGGQKLNLGSKLWRSGFTLTCFTVASLIVAAGFLFTQRSVSQILLHRGGKLVTIWTSAPFGSGSYFTVPLKHVSCMAHRSEVPSMIPLKIKGHPLYFLLDKQGQVFNAKLFDTTVGAYRKL